MDKLSGQDEEIAKRYFSESAEIAEKSECERKKCGSIIVKNGEVIGRGFNSSPGNKKRCTNSKKDYDLKVTDKTCCIHAEQRAIMDALKNNQDKLKGASLYFTRVDEQGNIQKSGKPYCTICSKMALDSGVRFFVLWHEEGIVSYETEEYNDLSFEYG